MTNSSGLSRRTLLYGTAATTPFWRVTLPTAAAAADASNSTSSDQGYVDESPLTFGEMIALDPPKILAEGRSPPARDEKAWNDLLLKFLEQYSVFADVEKSTQSGQELFGLQLNHRTKRIDNDFKYSDTKSAAFNPFRVETLMNQVADLLDRCLATKKEWEDNATKGANLFLDVIKFIREERVENDEIAEGKFILPYQTSNAESSSNMTDMKSLGEAQRIYSEAAFVAPYSEEQRKKYFAASQLLALAPYGISQAAMNYEFVWMGSKVKLWEHARDAADVMVNYDWWSKHVSFAGQIAQNQMQLASKAVLQQGLSFKTGWDVQNIRFQKRRTRITRQMNEAKVALATLKGGSLNFAERMSGAARRFQEDFTDALDRFVSLQQGMEAIYGVRLEVPKSISLVVAGQALSFSDAPDVTEAPLDGYVTFVRSAISKVLRIIDSDQQFTLGRSLRAMIPDDAWAKGVSEGGVWKLSLNRDDFDGYRYPRIRGIAVFADWENAPNLLQIRLTPPRQSFTRDSRDQWRPLDQGHLPACQVGNVGFRESNRLPDTVGAQVLFNSSPIGEWEVRIVGMRSPRGLQSLSDIQIEWQLAAQIG
jgi:hypothetical protein